MKTGLAEPLQLAAPGDPSPAPRTGKGALVRLHPDQGTDGHGLGRVTRWAASRGVQYGSTDDRDEDRVYSGRVFLPTFWRKGPVAVPLVVFVHGTELQRREVPFFNRGPETRIGAMAANACGCVVAMPDLPGMGLDPSPRPHPFCHAKALAHSVLDMIPAALASLDPAELTWDGRLFIMGYSAGGYAAMAAVREAQTNPAFSGIQVTGSACMGGPFHFSEAVRGILTDAVTPFSRPYIQTYLIHAFHDLYPEEGLFAPERAFNASLLRPHQCGALDDGDLLQWLDGALAGDAVNARIRLRLKGDPEAPLCGPEVLDPQWVATYLSAKAWPDTPVGRILRQNDLVGGWVPRSPMLLAASPADECVAGVNTAMVLKEWAREGCRTELELYPLTWRGAGLDHLKGGLMALMKAFWWIRMGDWPTPGSARSA
jgi:alpha-beta hydrolase superfamily lysophospholipase